MAHIDTRRTVLRNPSTLHKPHPPLPAKWIAGGEGDGRCAGVSGRGGESVPVSLACGGGAALSDSATNLGYRGLVGASDASEHLPSPSPPASTLLDIVIYLPASADTFPDGIIDPFDGTFRIAVADIRPHRVVAFIEGLYAVQIQIALPHREYGGTE